ncbi:hypothetical protein ACFLTO_05350 [Chloroflexota bacterium]
MKKLVCDKCRAELTDKYAIELALEGKEAWEATVRAWGAEPRGVFPCEHYVRCGGEMKLLSGKRIFH